MTSENVWVQAILPLRMGSGNLRVMPPDDAPEFTQVDAHVVHHAMSCAEEEARNRQVGMPSSADAFRKHATQLKIVRDKILRLLPARVRKNFPA